MRRGTRGCCAFLVKHFELNGELTRCDEGTNARPAQCAGGYASALSWDGRNGPERPRRKAALWSSGTHSGLRWMPPP